jgi:hypothetical protein
MTDDITSLASYRHTTERITKRWSAFQDRRAQRLCQQGRYGNASEKVAEDIVQDLFTDVLDWTVGDLNNQVEYADLLLSRLSVKHLLIEIKRPGALAWNRRAVDSALAQARGYADRQKVRCIAVSDGSMLYATDIANGGCSPRVFASLESSAAPLELWWLSVQGIWRRRLDTTGTALAGEPPPRTGAGPEDRFSLPGGRLHPKYKLPCTCFAYAGDADDPATWKLPYRCADGSVDVARLPKAIQAILSNYRGATVRAIPEDAIPDVLSRLARAAANLGRLPEQCGNPAPIYEQLVAAMAQFGRVADTSALSEPSNAMIAVQHGSNEQGD